MENQPEDDIVLSGIDAFLPVGKAQKSILDKVDAVLEQAIEEKNPDIAFNYTRGLLGVSQISGLAFAKVIYTMSLQWKSYGRRGTFEENAIDEFGRGKKTLKDNYRVWEMLVSGDIPKEYSDKFLTMPIRILIPIATMWSQGWEIETNDWMRLANAPDPTTVRKIIQEIKHVEPKVNSLQINLESDGTIYAWKNGIRVMVGSLNVDDKDEIVQAAIERLIGDGKVLLT